MQPVVNGGFWVVGALCGSLLVNFWCSECELVAFFVRSSLSEATALGRFIESQFLVGNLLLALVEKPSSSLLIGVPWQTDLLQQVSWVWILDLTFFLFFQFLNSVGPLFVLGQFHIGFWD